MDLVEKPGLSDFLFLKIKDKIRNINKNKNKYGGKI